MASWKEEALISRSEVVGMLWAIQDIAAYMRRLVRVVEGDDGGEEGEDST